MATELTSTVPAGTLPYSNLLAPSFFLMAVQDTLSLYGHPALVDLRGIAQQLNAPKGQTLASTITVQIEAPASAWSSTNEGTAVAADTSIDPTYATISVGNYDLAHGVSDELRRRDSTGQFNWPAIVRSMVTGWQLTFTGLVVALANSMTNTVGSTGNPITLDLIRDARDSVEVNGKSLAGGNFVAVLAPQQWNMLRADIQDRGGAIERRADYDAMQRAGLSNYKGSYDGIDYWTSDQTPESSGDYSGCMFASGAIGHLVLEQAEATASQVRIFDAGILTLEEARDASAKTTRLIGAATIGVSILRQEIACKILSIGS